MNRDKKRIILKIIKILKVKTLNMPKTLGELISKAYHNDPYFLLISCLLSLRSRDTLTYKVSLDLFKYAKNFNELYHLPLNELESIIQKINFYKTKAKTLHNVAKIILEKFQGNIPKDKQTLLSIKGIGEKTATFMLSYAFKEPAICVDTHVNKISNRLGLVNTTNPNIIESELEKIVPKNYWNDINNLFVKLGQNICKSHIPLCSQCPISKLCPKIGVKISK